MFRLRVSSHFDAAHQLIGHSGRCQNLHGHRWTVELYVVGNSLNHNGLLIDFRMLKSQLMKWTNALDHTFLNNLTDMGNPSAENIARYLYSKLQDLPRHISLEKVRVWESPDSWSEYWEES